MSRKCIISWSFSPNLAFVCTCQTVSYYLPVSNQSSPYSSDLNNLYQSTSESCPKNLLNRVSLKHIFFVTICYQTDVQVTNNLHKDFQLLLPILHPSCITVIAIQSYNFMKYNPAYFSCPSKSSLFMLLLGLINSKSKICTALFFYSSLCRTSFLGEENKSLLVCSIYFQDAYWHSL